MNIYCFNCEYNRHPCTCAHCEDGDEYKQSKLSKQYEAEIRADERAKNAINMIAIPENATNGDMIKVMFPKAEIHQSGGYTSASFQSGTLLEDRRSEWWNSPYKKGE